MGTGARNPPRCLIACPSGSWGCRAVDDGERGPALRIAEGKHAGGRVYPVLRAVMGIAADKGQVAL